MEIVGKIARGEKEIHENSLLSDQFSVNLKLLKKKKKRLLIKTNQPTKQKVSKSKSCIYFIDRWVVWNKIINVNVKHNIRTLQVLTRCKFSLIIKTSFEISEVKLTPEIKLWKPLYILQIY